MKKIFLFLFVIYAFILNPVLFVSMFISLLTTTVVLLFNETDEEGVVNGLMDNGISEEELKKYCYNLFFGGVLFMALTELIYSMFLNVN